MKFDDNHAFEKPVDTVLEMFSDRAYFEKKYKNLGFSDIEVLDCDKSGDRFLIKVRYAATSDAPIPQFAKKVLGDKNIVTQQDEWNLKSKTGRITIDVKGVPVKLGCEMRLQPEGKGSVNRMSWSISCGIPLIGGKLEKIIGDDILSKSDKDRTVSAKLLESYGA